MRTLITLTLAVAIAGCANTAKYQPSHPYSGGYTEQKLSDSVYQVRFTGNNTDQLTIQTYWLYRAAELTIEKGFDSFEIISPSPTEVPTRYSDSIRIKCPDLNLMCLVDRRTPWEEARAEIRMFKGLVKTVPYRVFDARTLKARMTPVVKGKNCGDPGLMIATSKVCPHDRSYIVSP